MKKPIAAVALLSACAAWNLQAEGQSASHGQTMNHSVMGAESMDQTETPGTARGQGIVDSVDSAGRSINVVHEPIPALGWPAMRMDIPVTEQVDLSGVKPGDKVDFRLVLDSDNVYRITELSHAP